MGCGLAAMFGNAGNFSLKQCDPLAKLVVRIPVERLQRQLAGHIACTARALIKFHREPLCDRLSLAVNRLHGYVALRAVYYSAAPRGRAALMKCIG